MLGEGSMAKNESNDVGRSCRISDFALRLRDCSDQKLLEQCRWETFRGSGPGGQKRNKTSSAVRIIHEPTGITAVAGELRSQAANRKQALRRLRWRLVLKLRAQIDPAHFVPPAWWLQRIGKHARLDMPSSSDCYLPAAGLVLDVLAATNGAVAEAAKLLHVHTAQLVQFLEDDQRLWAAVNDLRAAADLKPLR